MSVIKRYKGDTYSVEAVLTKDGIPIDFSDVNNTAKFSFSKGDVYHTIDGTGDATGSITFPFIGLEAVVAGTYKYDIQVTTVDGIRTYVKSDLVIEPDITQ